MRSDLIHRFPNTYEYWGYQVTTNADGATTVKFAKTDDRKGLVLNSAGKITVMSTEQMPLYSQVRNIKDRHGRSISPTGNGSRGLYVTNVAPQMDTTGACQGWIHLLSMDLPTNYAVAITKAIQTAVSGS